MGDPRLPNDALMAQLTSLARDNARIDPAAFDCPFYKECNSSADNLRLASSVRRPLVLISQRNALSQQ
jgi:hypothetical protein